MGADFGLERFLGDSCAVPLDEPFSFDLMMIAARSVPESHFGRQPGPEGTVDEVDGNALRHLLTASRRTSPGGSTHLTSFNTSAASSLSANPSIAGVLEEEHRRRNPRLPRFRAAEPIAPGLLERRPARRQVLSARARRLQAARDFAASEVASLEP